MIAPSTSKQIIPSAFILPFGDLIVSYNHTFKKLTGFSFEKNPVASETGTSESFFLKIRRRKGLNSPSERTENRFERTLKLK